MKWKKVENSRNQIKKAGKKFAKNSFDDVIDKERAIDIIDNWRAAHAYPLQIIASNLRSKVKGRDFIVVQRLKRFDSIVSKLKRKPWIGLYDMQDLAGCRVIVPSVDDVYDIMNEYKNSKIKHKFHHTDDYIEKPKASGYRGVHMIYRYHSNKNNDYEGMFVEIQFRTQLQHMWSTAVETMGIYTGTNLKAGEGPENILRFFSLMSSIFAFEENRPLVPNTHETLYDLIGEIKYLCEKEKILKALSAIRSATQEIARRGNNANYYILALDFETNRLTIKEYAKSEVDLATAEYIVMENQKDEGKTNVVLVSASSIKDLKYAYPNYFTDIGEFVKRVDTIVNS